MTVPLQPHLNDAHPLHHLRCGDTGCIVALKHPEQTASEGLEIERGLLEMGFVEGAHVELLHVGFPGNEPLAVRINQAMTVALRRYEAHAVWVNVDTAAVPS